MKISCLVWRLARLLQQQEHPPRWFGAIDLLCGIFTLIRPSSTQIKPASLQGSPPLCNWQDWLLLVESSRVPCSSFSHPPILLLVSILSHWLRTSVLIFWQGTFENLGHYICRGLICWLVFYNVLYLCRCWTQKSTKYYIARFVGDIRTALFGVVPMVVPMVIPIKKTPQLYPQVHDQPVLAITCCKPKSI
jgi:hypothetical protein